MTYLSQLRCKLFLQSLLDTIASFLISRRASQQNGSDLVPYVTECNSSIAAPGTSVEISCRTQKSNETLLSIVKFSEEQ
jgi:hypothetical protein